MHTHCKKETEYRKIKERKVTLYYQYPPAPQVIMKNILEYVLPRFFFPLHMHTHTSMNINPYI